MTETKPLTTRDLLPDNVKPRHYDLLIQLDSVTGTFTGSVKIELDLIEPTKAIVLHYRQGRMILGAIEHNSVTQFISEQDVKYEGSKCKIILKNRIDPSKDSKAFLHISFAGAISNSMEGFYRSSYIYNNEQKYIYSTQFEAVACRRVFPCFDEPRSKATFSLTLECDRDMIALSNCEEVSVENFTSQTDRPMKRVAFAKTPKMSTYLLAWTLGEFESLEAENPGTNMPKIPNRVFATKGKSIYLRYALDHGIKSLEFFSGAFGVPYVLNKCDHVAIPDFEAGAMENWGLITYRESRLLYDEQNSGASWREQISDVISHELAHQWFGNLVTMKYWDSLWLNEGFATWMSTYANDNFYPEWKLWEQCISNNLQVALKLDGMRSSHPIEAQVRNDYEIEEIFDAISYNKGSCMIRMLSKYLGEDVFMAGIKRYIQDHKYTNTVTEDLWKALSIESGINVNTIMKNWIQKQGYPYLFVQKISNNRLKISQNRFLESGDATDDENNVIYSCPLGIKTMNISGTVNTEKTHILQDREVILDFPDSVKAIKVNADQTAFYRTAYEQSLFEEIINYPTNYFKFLSAVDRACLVSDTNALSNAGYIPIKNLLRMLQMWKMDSERIVWEQMGSAAFELVTGPFLFENGDFREKLYRFLRSLFSSKALELGWEFQANENHNACKFKALLFNYAASCEVPEVVTACKQLFDNRLNVPINPNIRAIVFKTALRNGGIKEWNALYDIYLHTSNVDEKISALKSLGEAPDELRERTLNLVLSAEVKAQDMIYPVIQMGGTAKGANEMWEFFTKNYEALYKKTPGAGTLISSVVKIFIPRYNSLDQKRTVETFFSDKVTLRYRLALAQSLERISSNAKVVARDKVSVEDFLDEMNFRSQ